MDSKTKFKQKYSYTPVFEEINEGISETIPGQNTDLRQLIQRQRNGQEVRQFQPQFDGATSLEDWQPNWETMDKIERELALQQVRQNINNIRNKLTETAKQKLYDDISKDAKAEQSEAKADIPKVE